MNNKLENKVVVITGAGGGIGNSIANKLSTLGAKIVLLGGNNLEKLKLTQTEVSHFSECLCLPGDLTNLSFLKESITTIKKEFGGIDILINNAGMALSSDFEDVTEQQFDKIFDINVKAPFFLIQYAIPFLKESDYATIINISSVVGHVGYPLQSAYAASKHAILGMTKSIANEYYEMGIRTHAISPGGVYTDMVKVARPDLSSEGMISPDEIATIVEFFLVNRGNAVIDEIIVHRRNKEPFLI